jgi:FMN reductase
MMKLVIVIGAATPPGRLNQAMNHVAAGLAERRPDVAAVTMSLADTQIDVCDGRKIEECSPSTQKAVAEIMEADAALISAPVYRASYPGILKNLLDQLPVDALRDKPVGIVAMGGSPHHYLAVDSHLRMVLAWFGALAMPSSVYLTGKDFAEGKLASQVADADLSSLADALIDLAKATKQVTLGPSPLAARY